MLWTAGRRMGRNEAGPWARVERMYRLVNERTSPTEYFSEPRSMLAACQDIDRAGLEIVAVYHSHPTSPPVPSKKDIEQNYLGDVVHVIVSLDRSIEMRAWWLTDGIHEIAISTG